MPSLDKRSEIICKTTLIVVFLLGVALLLGGLWGNRQYEAAGGEMTDNIDHYGGEGTAAAAARAIEAYR